MATPAQYEAFAKLFGKIAEQQAAPAANVAAPAVVDYGANSGYDASGKVVAPPVVSPQKDSGGIDLGFSPMDALTGLGKMALKPLEGLDYGRAAIVSGMKELADTFEGSRFGEWYAKHLNGMSDAEYQKRKQEWGSGSWNDFLKQTGRHMGFGEIIQLTDPNAPLWEKRIAGFAGDVISDPLMYLHPGVSMEAASGNLARTATQEAADSALRFAVKEGSSAGISRALVDSAKAAGMEVLPQGQGFANDAVNRLIVDAAERGRGALTKAGLERAGIDAATAEQLGIGKLGRTYLHGAVNIPLSEKLVGVTEGVKGSTKAFFRTGAGEAGSQFLRSHFLPTVAGKRALAMGIMDSSKGIGERAAHVMASTTINDALRFGRMWGIDTEKAIQAAMKDAHWYNMTPDVAAAATHALESGTLDAQTQVVRDFFDNVHKQLSDLGIDVPKRENYVPHMITDEARAAMRKNPELKALIRDSLSTKESFMKARLTEGTIKEINQESMAKYGVKLFEEDVRKIIPKYVQQASEAMIRQRQIDNLVEHGLIREQAIKIVTKPNEDPHYLEQVANAVAGRKAAGTEARQAYAEGARLRRDALIEARSKVDNVIRDSNQAIREQQRIVDKFGRELTVAQDKLAQAERDLQAAKTGYERWSEHLKTYRNKTERRSALASLNRNKALMEEKQALVDSLRQEIDAKVREQAPLLEQISNTQAADISTRKIEDFNAVPQAELAANRAEVQATTNAFDAGQARINELKARVQAADATLAEHRKKLDFVEHYVDRTNNLFVDRKLNVGKLQTAADDAANVYAFAAADSQHVVDHLQKMIHELDAIRPETIVGRKGVGASVSAAAHAELRDRLQTVASVLESQGMSPEAKVLAGVEAAAAQLDIKAMNAADTEQMFKDMFDALHDQRFIDVAKHYLAPNAVAIGQNMEMPKWLAEATTVEEKIKQLSAFGTFGKKFYNLFKGYAILTPGFHMRNAYSAMYNMYLEAGPEVFKSAQKWHDFYVLTQKNPANYMEEAVKRWGQEDATRLQNAWSVVAGSGSGQTAGEFSADVLRKGSKNPFSENFALLKKNRQIGESIENHVRGIHAYDVMRRGGSPDQALDIINKWHFNYTDLSDFDRKAKIVMPFWTFWSRNIALQSMTWTRNASRLNRSWRNFERNMGMGQAADTLIPQYLTKQGAIRVGTGPTGVARYLIPDLPATRWPNEINQLTSIHQWPEVAANLGPWLKIPIEAFAGKSLMTGAKLKDTYVPVPNGFRQLLSASGVNIDSLPTNILRQGASGPMIDANYLQALTSAIPPLTKLQQLVPATSGKDIGPSLLSSLLGVSFYDNTAQSKRNEQYRRMLERQAQAKREASLRKG